MGNIVWLRDADRSTDWLELGGKAAILSQLAQDGFPVPDGFVLLPSAFTVSLPDNLLGQSSSNGQQVLIPSIPDRLAKTLQQELAAALTRLCPKGELVAVRSSALEEDGVSHSFAGQLDSFLQVHPLSVAEKIIAVWRSGFSPRLLHYRQECQLPKPPAPPAVLIQRMVNAEVAGVAFGANPLTGQRGITLISAVRGLGEGLVSGERAADTYTLDRWEKIVERQLEASACEKAPLLREEQVRAIAHLVQQVGHYYHAPQDIEWAMADGEIYLLQCRAITTLARLPDPDGNYQIWDNSNIVESFPGVTTPLTFSFARIAYESVYRQFCGFMNVPSGMIARNSQIFRNMIGCIQGRIYYNLLNWYRLLALLPGSSMNARFMEQMMGVRQSLPADVVAKLQQAVRPPWWQDGGRLLATLIGLAINYFTLPRRIKKFYQRLERTLTIVETGERPLDMRLWRGDELAARYRMVEEELLAHWDAPLINDFFAMIFYGWLRRLTTGWCGDADRSLQNNLIGGEGGVISTEPMRQMQSMAELIVTAPELVHLFCTGTLTDITVAISQMPELLSPYQDYLTRFGDRCLEELKLESPTLHDDPLPLLRSLGHLAAGQLQQIAPPTSVLRARERRQAAEQKVLAKLSGQPLRLWVFRWVLDNARKHIRNRENLRLERTRVFGAARRIFVELGYRLYASHHLQRPEDVFYLEVPEVLGFVEGSLSSADLGGLAAVRRAEFDRYRQLPPAGERLTTRGMVYQGNSFGSLATPTSSNDRPCDEERQGTGCSPGEAIGSVQLIRDSQQLLQQPNTLAYGSILVAESTDPGWILLFSHAAGVLVERGSLLSHVAIVCRELGIPMITSLPGIMQWLQDGEQVAIDGATGRVQKVPLSKNNLSIGGCCAQ